MTGRTKRKPLVVDEAAQRALGGVAGSRTATARERERPRVVLRYVCSGAVSTAARAAGPTRPTACKCVDKALALARQAAHRPMRLNRLLSMQYGVRTRPRVALTRRRAWASWGMVYVCLAAVLFSCASATEVPVLVDEPAKFVNASGSEPRAELVYYRNMPTVTTTLAGDKGQVIPVLRGRVKDENVPLTLRVLYAGMLACHADEEGQNFLIRCAERCATDEEAQDVFWVMGHLHWFMRRPEQKEHPTIDMHWAEDIIVSTLKSQATVRSRYGNGHEVAKASVAVGDGGFANLLADLGGERACPVLMELYQRMDWADILSALGKLKDKRTIPLFVQNLRSPDTRKYGTSIRALTAMGAPEALPAMLGQLNRSETYSVLRRYPQADVVTAVEKALPGLSDPYARGEAQLFILDRRGGDRLPTLMALARDPTFESETSVMHLIEEMHDERAVPFAAEVLETSPDLLQRKFAIGILASFRSPQAVKALIDALDIDFNALARAKDVMCDNNREQKTRIAKYLRAMTGQPFEAERAAWLEWYERAYAAK